MTDKEKLAAIEALLDESDLAGRIREILDARPAQVIPEGACTIELGGKHGKGLVAIVDREDYGDVLFAGKWHRREDGYAVAGARHDGLLDKNTRLHHFIAYRRMGIAPGTMIDHINGERLDCRRCNLRATTPSANAHNCNRKNKLGVRGVRFVVGRKRPYIAQWKEENTVRRGPARYTVEEARKDYVEAIKRIHGEHARVEETGQSSGD